MAFLVAELAQPIARSGDQSLTAYKRLAIVPALNEEASVAAVIDEIRRVDQDFEIVVVDDGSTDGTAEAAARAGAVVVRLPYNLGIGGAVQTGYQYARDHGFELAVQIDGDGQHDPSELERLIRPIVEGEADLTVGTRFAGARLYRSPFGRRIGIRLFAGVVSAMVRRRVTDPTSGFRAVNRRGIRLFAADYPHDFPEVESSVLAVRHRLRMLEVPVAMRERATGRSSITTGRGIYYMIKVMLALFISLFRRYPPLEEER